MVYDISRHVLPTAPSPVTTHFKDLVAMVDVVVHLEDSLSLIQLVQLKTIAGRRAKLERSIRQEGFRSSKISENYLDYDRTCPVIVDFSRRLNSRS